MAAILPQLWSKAREEYYRNLLVHDLVYYDIWYNTIDPWTSESEDVELGPQMCYQLFE